MSLADIVDMAEGAAATALTMMSDHVGHMRSDPGSAFYDPNDRHLGLFDEMISEVGAMMQETLQAQRTISDVATRLAEAVGIAQDISWQGFVGEAFGVEGLRS